VPTSRAVPQAEGWPVRGEGAVAGLGLLAGEQVRHVGLLVDPSAPDVLVETHCPERDDLALGVGVVARELPQLGLEGVQRLGGIALGDARDEVERVGVEAALELLEGDEPVLAGGRAVGLRDGARLLELCAGFVLREVHLTFAQQGVVLGGGGVLVGGAHAEADVGRAGGEHAVLVHEVGIDEAARDDLAGDVVPDGEVGVRLEDDFRVGDGRGAVAVGRQVDDAVVLPLEALVGDAGPEHGVHLGHIGTPGDDGIGEFDVVVAAGGFVDAEGLDEAGNGRGHAVARVGVDVVRAPAGLGQLDGGVALLDRVLAGAHDADAGGAELLVDALELLLHFVEGAFPGDGDEVAVLGVDAVAHTQQGLGEAIAPVGDEGVGVPLDAEETAIDRAVGVALDGDDATLLHGGLDAAAGAAESTGALVPGPAGFGILRELAGEGASGEAEGGGGGGGDGGFEQVAS